MPLDRRQFVGSVGTAGALAFAGCLGGGDDNSGSDTAANVGMVYATGGLGDGSFNDQAQSGIQRAEEDLGISYNESQPEEVAEFGNLQQQYAQSTSPDYDLVSCIGFLQADALSETAPEYSDQDFMIVDSVPTNEDGEQFGNVGSYVFSEHEGSFLIGMMAGRLTSQSFEAGSNSTSTDSTNVGFVGGVESDLIKKFEAGYTAGVKHANEDVDVQTSYVGGFSDPSGGKEAALSMYNSGADLIFHAAGQSGTGVFQAAQEQGRFAFGVDRDQSVTLPDYSGVILASMVKRVDTAVYTAVEQVVNDEFEGGATTALGLSDNGVEAVYGQDLGSQIPQEIKDEVSTARDDIINGDIDVPQSP
ncbi:BMP family lipoprotein [Halostella litorea]|uniref:BMP family lipoprotein n=1 Tax=Halostella litorea TaxID=2528831 RepID=UPI0010924D83|nr:BMP family protein [Halostella litorea]